MKCLDEIIDSMDMSLSKLRKSEGQGSGVLQPMGSQRVRHASVTKHSRAQTHPQHAQKLPRNAHSTLVGELRSHMLH